MYETIHAVHQRILRRKIILGNLDKVMLNEVNRNLKICLPMFVHNHLLVLQCMNEEDYPEDSSSIYNLVRMIGFRLENLVHHIKCEPKNLKNV